MSVFLSSLAYRFPQKMKAFSDLTPRHRDVVLGAGVQMLSDLRLLWVACFITYYNSVIIFYCKCRLPKCKITPNPLFNLLMAVGQRRIVLLKTHTV